MPDAGTAGDTQVLLGGAARPPDKACCPQPCCPQPRLPPAAPRRPPAGLEHRTKHPRAQQSPPASQRPKAARIPCRALSEPQLPAPPQPRSPGTAGDGAVPPLPRPRPRYRAATSNRHRAPEAGGDSGVGRKRRRGLRRACGPGWAGGVRPVSDRCQTVPAEGLSVVLLPAVQASTVCTPVQVAVGIRPY